MIKVITIKNRFFPSNTYLVFEEDSKECLIIDPGLDKKVIEEAIDETGLVPSHILATHGHFDHVGSALYFQLKYNAPFYIHENDLKITKSINFFLKIMKIDMWVEVPIADQLIKGFETHLTINNFPLSIYNFPGHSDGSCLLQFENVIFTGDTLYSKGLGINPFPGQNKERLRESLKTIMNLFPGNPMIYPGHGRAGRLESIKLNNKELMLFLQELAHE